MNKTISKKISCTKFAILLLILFNPVRIHATIEQNVRIGIYQNKPKIYLDAENIPRGIFVDLLNEIGKEEGWKLVYIPYEWEDGLEALRKGEIDIMPDVAISVERLSNYSFNRIPVLESWSQIYSLAGKDLNTLSDLDGKRIAILKGSVQEVILRQMMKGFGFNCKLITAVSLDSVFILVGNNEADAAVSNHFFGEAHYKEYQLVKTTIVFNPVSLHFASRLGNNLKLLQKIDLHLEKWKNSGNSIYYKILSSYLERRQDPFLPGYFMWIAIISISLILLLVFVIGFLRKRIRYGALNHGETLVQLQEEKNKFQLLTDNMEQIVWSADPDLKFTYLNKAVSSLTGFTPHELIGKNISVLLGDEYSNIISNELQKVYSGEEAGRKHFQTTMLKKDKTPLTVKFSFQFIKSAEGQITRLQGEISDITGEIEANKNILASQRKFKSYIDNAPYGVFVANEKGDYLEVNDAAAKITNYHKDELIGKNILELIPAEMHNDAFEHFNKVVINGEASDTFPFLTKDGDKRYWTVDAVKLSEDRFLGFVNDITDNILYQKRIDRLSKIFEYSLNEIYLFEVDSLRFIEANLAATQNIGYSLEELKNLSPLDIKLEITEEEFNKIIEPLKSGQKEKIIFESKHFRKDGSTYNVEVHLQLMQYENTKIFTAVVLDISDRKKVEFELRELKEQLELQVEEKTKELKQRITELEKFHDVTIERELRMKELRDEIEKLKKNK